MQAFEDAAFALQITLVQIYLVTMRLFAVITMASQKTHLPRVTPNLLHVKTSLPTATLAGHLRLIARTKGLGERTMIGGTFVAEVPPAPGGILVLLRKLLKIRGMTEDRGKEATSYLGEARRHVT